MALPKVSARIRLGSIYVLLTLPFVAYGAATALRASNNSPIDWVTAEFPARQEYDEFVSRFGPGDALVVSWPGCTWDDERLNRLTKVFRNGELFRDSEGEPCFHRVVSGRETLIAMTNQPSASDETSGSLSSTDVSASQEKAGASRRGLPLETAVKRLTGTMIGSDGKTTCLVLYFTDNALAERARLVRLVQKAVSIGCEVALDDVHMAGPVIDGWSVDEASQSSLKNYALPSSLLIFGICWLSLRSLRAAVIVFATASFCQGVTLAVIHFTGQSLSALLIILPPLIQVLAVAGGIHLTNYYFDASPGLSPEVAAEEALRKGWLPCILSAATTGMGTASLMISGLTPIRQFGGYATVGVLLTAASVLTAVPAALSLFAVRRNRTASGQLSAENSVGDSVPQKRRSNLVWTLVHGLLHKWSGPVAAGLLAVMGVAAYGLPRVQTSVRIETLFASDSRIMRDYEWLESHVGDLVPLEILIHFDKSSRLPLCERMGLLHQLEKSLLQHSEITAVTSALTFMPPIPSLKDLPERVKQVAVNRIVSAATPAFQAADVLRKTSDAGEVWRVTAHCSALRPLDYGLLLQEVEHHVSETLNQNVTADDRPTFTTSGVMPLVHQIQGQLLSDLFKSLVSALLVITVTMTIVEAGIVAGMVAMLSNIFPIVVMFGIMGWSGVAMDIGAVMTASVALGIAVDDTLHFLTFFRRGMASGHSRSQAVLYGYQHCGRAMIQTSFSCGLGLLVFALSDFVPTSRFAVMMGGLLILALVGDLILLPALLLSTAGQFFRQPLRQEPQSFS